MQAAIQERAWSRAERIQLRKKWRTWFNRNYRLAGPYGDDVVHAFYEIILKRADEQTAATMRRMSLLAVTMSTTHYLIILETLWDKIEHLRPSVLELLICLQRDTQGFIDAFGGAIALSPGDAASLYERVRSGERLVLKPVMEKEFFSGGGKRPAKCPTPEAQRIHIHLKAEDEDE